VTHHVYLDRDQEIPPYSISVVRLRVADIEKGKLEPMIGLVEPLDVFIEKTDLLPTLGAFVEPDKKGRFLNTVMNTTDRAIRLRKTGHSEPTPQL